MIPPEHKQLLDQIAKAYASELYKDMQEPIYRGKNFKWENFPALVGRIVYTHTFLSFSDEDFQPEYKDYARDEAIKYAKELMNEQNT